MIAKDYLGDSVYAEFDGYAIVLTTDNGMGASNTIVMEPEVLRALDGYRARIAEAIESLKANQSANAPTPTQNETHDPDHRA